MGWSARVWAMIVVRPIQCFRYRYSEVQPVASKQLNSAEMRLLVELVYRLFLEELRMGLLRIGR